MTDGTNDRTDGQVDEVKGRAKSAWGNVTGDDKTKGEGELDQVKGNIKQGIGDLKDEAGKLFDDKSSGQNRNQ